MGPCAMMASVQQRWIDYQPLDTIERARRNPKAHDLAALGASVARYGLVEPIVADERTGRLVAGHGRLDHLAALRSDGATPPDGVALDDQGVWLAPVVRGWASRDDAHADAYLVASFRILELGGWDSAALGALLQGLSETDLAAVGFEPADVGRLLDEVGVPSPALDTLPAPALPAPDRQVQGLREVVLILQGDNFRLAQAHLERLRSAWGEDVAAVVVLRALRQAVDAA